MPTEIESFTLKGNEDGSDSFNSMYVSMKLNPHFESIAQVESWVSINITSRQNVSLTHAKGFLG